MKKFDKTLEDLINDCKKVLKEYLKLSKTYCEWYPNRNNLVIEVDGFGDDYVSFRHLMLMGDDVVGVSESGVHNLKDFSVVTLCKECDWLLSHSTIFAVTDIEYDADEDDIEDFDLPSELTIAVNNNIINKTEYISNEITNITGFCHKGFSSTPKTRYCSF